MASKGQRGGNQLPVPDIREDAAERKRVLNVLAQRRYRKRKREQVAALKAQLKDKHDSGTENEPAATDSSSQSQGATFDAATGSGDSSAEISEPALSQADPMRRTADPASPDTVRQFHEAILETLSTSASSSSSSSFSAPMASSSFQPSFVNPENLQAPVSYPPLSSLPVATSDLPSLPSLPFSSSAPADAVSPPPTFEFLGSSVTLDQLPTQDLSTALQWSESSTFTFPDDHLLEVSSLTLLRAMLTVARRLNLMSCIWDPNGISPFYTGPRGPDASNGYQSSSTTRSASDHSNLNSSHTTSPYSPDVSITGEDLPTHLRPTQTQRLVPHHALLDLFPWPTTRDKLIQVFSLPVELRPPEAADPMGLVGLVYDVEDPAEGMRVSGADPFAPEMWEVGQHVFERWWWAFEKPIVERSNNLRRERGQQGLVLGNVD